jgi:hypothetical protein
MQGLLHIAVANLLTNSQDVRAVTHHAGSSVGAGAAVGFRKTRQIGQILPR